MLGTQWRSGKRQAEQVADDAWEALVDAIESAGDTARSVGRRTLDLTGDAGDRVGSATEEARRRASAAYDALAGRDSSSVSWGWVFGAALAGIAVGWFAATVGPRAVATATEKMNSTDEEVGDDLLTSTSGSTEPMRPTGPVV